MRLLLVVQRYGKEVAGGAERACREYATHLAARGHSVDVLTSRAINYVDWSDHYPPGRVDIDGVKVHRLSVRQPRDHEVFGPLTGRVMSDPFSTAPLIQREWMRLLGPELVGIDEWLDRHIGDFDVAICFTYLYWTTGAVSAAIRGRIPVVLHPCAHDEPYLAVPLFEELFRRSDALAFLTEEEQRLVQRRFACSQPSIVTGVGIDLGESRVTDDIRSRFGIGDRPYVIFVGRLDPVGKASKEIFDFFRAYKQRRPGPLALVTVGEPVRGLPSHPDVFATGFVEEDVKEAAIANAVALVQPSYYESFSIVLIEAWKHRKPALVQGHCEVLEGQAMRSGGAIPYRGYVEFEAALDILLECPEVAERLGRAGRRYVEAHYEWDALLERYESFVADVARAH